MSEHPWRVNSGGSSPVMAGTPEQLAVKNLLHDNIMQQGISRSAQRMYWEVCNSSRSGDAFRLGKRDSLRLLEAYMPPKESCPCFLRGLVGLGDGCWLAVEGERREAVLFSFDQGPVPLPEGMGRDIFSLTELDDGYLFLPHDYQALKRVDRTFNPIGSCDISGLNMAAKWVFLSRTDGGFVLVTKPQKTVVFLDRECRPISTIGLNHLSRITPGIGYGDGVILFEWSQKRVGYGEMIWVSSDKRVLSIAGGLTKPFSATCFDEGMLVCDLKGLHVLTMDGLAVVGRTVYPWEWFLKPLGLAGCYGREAVMDGDNIVLIFNLGRSTIFASRRYCAARFGL